jgi:hypothetical protein
MKFSLVKTVTGLRVRAQQVYYVENVPSHVVALAYEWEKFKHHC